MKPVEAAVINAAQDYINARFGLVDELFFAEDYLRGAYVAAQEVFGDVNAVLVALDGQTWIEWLNHDR